MQQQFFDYIIQLPSEEFDAQYSSLVGLDDVKSRLVKETEILLNPLLLAEWSVRHYHKVIPIVKLFENRHALFIFAGDVGTGKTSLAESFGSHFAREKQLRMELYRLSLKSRGEGRGGEMTKSITQAFSEIETYVNQLINPDNTFSTACIVLIDEADALGQSRDDERMEHEAKTAVDALIQGLDSFLLHQLPVITIMCTNRLSSLDPAILRRASNIFTFERPSDIQRKALFDMYLSGTDVQKEDIDRLTQSTGPTHIRPYGYTYSDIIRTILPALVVETYPDKPVTFTVLDEILKRIPPTPPMHDWTVLI